jgi:hypothetical protein
LVLLFVIPLGHTNLENNMWIQYTSFILSILLALQWVLTSFFDSFGNYKGLDPDLLQEFAPLDDSYGKTIGTIMLNFAIVTMIPSWINVKQKDVNVQKAVWSSTILVTCFYIWFGILMAMGYDFTGISNILPVLRLDGYPSFLTKCTVYMFAFAMLIPSISINLIISKENLIQNDVAPIRLSKFLSLVLPWFIALLFQTGNTIFEFQLWTSLLFVSSTNYIIPVLIYFQCKEFRKKYNEDRYLTAKQLDLLKRIHYLSNSLVEHIGRAKEEKFMTNLNRESVLKTPLSYKNSSSNDIIISPIPTPSVENVDETLPKEHSPVWMREDVPDPDLEDQIELNLNPEKRESEIVATLKRLGRRLTGSHNSAKRDMVDIEVDVPQIKEPSPDQPAYPTFNEEDKIKSVTGSQNTGRFKTLPINNAFKTPAFRSVPKWMPFKAVHMAWFIMIVNLITTIWNILIILLKQ